MGINSTVEVARNPEPSLTALFSKFRDFLMANKPDGVREGAYFGCGPDSFSFFQVTNARRGWFFDRIPLENDGEHYYVKTPRPCIAKLGAGNPIRSGVNLVGHIDGTEHLEGGFVDKLKNLEEVKAACGDRFEGAVIVTRAGAEDCYIMRNEPVWKGERKYRIAPAKEWSWKDPSIDSVILSKDENASLPTVEELGDFFGQHWKPYRMKIAYFTGHGRGDRIGEISTKEIGAALQIGEGISGERAGIIFLEACVMSLEGLRPLQGKADAALATEETIPQNALPLKEMLKKACQGNSTPKEIAKAMVRIAEKKDGVRTFAAVDLDKIESLGKAVDRVKQLLVPELATQEGAKKVRAAIHNAYYYLPRARELGFGDLGIFLKSLTRRDFSTEIHRSVVVAQKRLEEAVLEKVTEPDYTGVSGISFDTRIGDIHFTWQEVFNDH